MKILITSDARFHREQSREQSRRRVKDENIRHKATREIDAVQRRRGFIIGGLKYSHHRNEAVAKIVKALVEELESKL